jgi:2-keto-4-pentenoate hydratase/2-oxohepta-3-ene-1,7-dioic acid hydratase in catechol pathway
MTGPAPSKTVCVGRNFREHAGEMGAGSCRISAVSGVMTLVPGDLVLTGTPSDVGPLRAGDVVEVEIPGVGVLRNPVEDEVAG